MSHPSAKLTKILHLSAEKSWRGGEQQIAYLIEESLKLGLQIHVACQKDSAFESHCLHHSIPHTSLSFRKLAGLPAALSIKKLCREQGISLIHAHSSHAQNAAIISASLGNPTPLIVSRKVIIPVKKKITTPWKYNHTSIKRFICVSHAAAQILRPAIQQAEKIVTVYDGIDPQRFKNISRSGEIRAAFQIPKKSCLILNIAALSHDKDLFTFLRTAKRVCQTLPAGSPPVHFLIAGSGPLQQALEAEIRTLQLNDHVTLAGFRQDIPELLQEADIFFTSSQSEGLGSSILDAFASLKPVVATAAGGIPELIEDHQSGLLAPIGDEAALSTALLKLIAQPELAKQLATNAHHLIDSKFHKRIMAKQTISHYREALHPHA